MTEVFIVVHCCLTHCLIHCCLFHCCLKKIKTGQAQTKTYQPPFTIFCYVYKLQDIFALFKRKFWQLKEAKFVISI